MNQVYDIAKAIEIVQAMYDEEMAQYNAIPSYIMVSEATLERIETLEEVLSALRKAMKGGEE